MPGQLSSLLHLAISPRLGVQLELVSSQFK